MFVDTTKQIASAMLVMSVIPNVYAEADPMPVLLVSAVEMPQEVPEKDRINLAFDKNIVDTAVRLYHDLRIAFGLSNTVMGNWLGVKRRTLYNWLNNPEKARTFGPQIESRLIELGKLKSEIEPEHLKLVNKIAFSPIYGDKGFGEAILERCNSDELISWYDKLYSRFESYRSEQNKKDRLI